MLRRRYRLRHPDDLRRLRQQGCSWRHPLVILMTQENDEEISRFAFIASRRVGKAVVRNRAKRLLREAVRLHLDEIEAGWDCLFIARDALPKASFDEVESAVLTLLSRAKLLSDRAVASLQPGAAL